jgi:hypothetical protein
MIGKRQEKALQLFSRWHLFNQQFSYLIRRSVFKVFVISPSQTNTVLLHHPNRDNALPVVDKHGA